MRINLNRILITANLCLGFISIGYGQSSRIAVLGSSTSAGQFNGLYPYDSGYVAKLNTFYKSEGLIDTIYNLAVSGASCYQAMPDGYVPPQGRPVPDKQHNITKAISMNPKPSVVLVNYPSNGYETYSIAEIMFCFQTIRDYALAHNVECFITTTQPRTDFSSAGRYNLKVIADSIMLRFKNYSVDFYSELTDYNNDYIIKTKYALGDNVHLNPAGHTVLKNKVIQKSIVLGPVPVKFSFFEANASYGNVVLTWNYENPERDLEYFQIERSVDGFTFDVINKIRLTGFRNLNFTDKGLSNGNYFYRIRAVVNSGATFISKTVSVRVGATSLLVKEAFISSGKLIVRLNSATSPVNYSLVNLNGATILKGVISEVDKPFSRDVSSLPKGSYVLLLTDKQRKTSLQLSKL